jgi:GTP:adenosylcobinamide-phosphate guanylyltransferase
MPHVHILCNLIRNSRFSADEFLILDHANPFNVYANDLILLDDTILNSLIDVLEFAKEKLKAKNMDEFKQQDFGYMRGIVHIPSRNDDTLVIDSEGNKMWYFYKYPENYEVFKSQRLSYIRKNLKLVKGVKYGTSIDTYTINGLITLVRKHMIVNADLIFKKTPVLVKVQNRWYKLDDVMYPSSIELLPNEEALTNIVTSCLCS